MNAAELGSAVGARVAAGRLRERRLAGGTLHTRWRTAGGALALPADQAID